MNINFGNKYKGKSVAEVVLKHPDYVKWVLGKNDAIGPLMIVQNEILKLIGIFNSKPFIQKCKEKNCGKTATRCSTYKDDFQGLYWWCDKCDPYQSGASAGTLHMICTYQDVLHYVSDTCKNRKEDYMLFVKILAQEKGLPNRIKNGDIDKFFLVEGILTF